MVLIMLMKLKIIKKLKLIAKKLNDKTIALSNSSSPSDKIMTILDNYKVVKFKSMRSSLKFCLIANGEFDLYLQIRELKSGI